MNVQDSAAIKCPPKKSNLIASLCYKRVQLFRVYCLLTGQTYTKDYITFTDVT